MRLARTSSPHHVANRKIKRVAIGTIPFLNTSRSIACDVIALGPPAIFGQGERHSGKSTTAGQDFSLIADYGGETGTALERALLAFDPKPGIPWLGFSGGCNG